MLRLHRLDGVFGGKMNIDDEVNDIAQQAWHTPRGECEGDELEAYLHKHTLNGAMREAHDAWVALGRVVVREIASLWLRILDTLGI